MVYGDYQQAGQQENPQLSKNQEQGQGFELTNQLIPTYSYSKEGRSDLKQVIILCKSKISKV